MSKLLQITSMQEKVDLIDFISNKAYPREYTVRLIIIKPPCF